MSEKIDVGKVAKLAKLRLKAEEEKYFAEKFESILQYFGSISQVDTENVKTDRDESLQIVSHTDIHDKSPVAPEQFSDNVENGFFRVPKVIE